MSGSAQPSPRLSRRAVLACAPAAAALNPTRLACAATEVGGVIVGKDGWLFPAWEGTPRALDRADAKEVAALIGRIVEAFGRADIRTVVAIPPAKVRLYAEHLPDDVPVTAEAGPSWDATLDRVRDTGAVTPDIATAFLRIRDSSPAPLYFKADSHWTASGGEQAAACVAEAMQQQCPLPPSAAPGVSLGRSAPQIAKVGNLAQALPPGMQADFPAEPNPRRVAVQTKRQLLDDPAADVAVVGNSFLDPVFGFPAMLSNQLNRPVSLFWRINTYGPYRILLDYLDSPLFQSNRPKVAVLDWLETNLDALPDSRRAFGDYAMPAEAFVDRLGRAVDRAR